jgi:hypothetical protein
MRKLSFVAASAFTYLFVTAATALAGSELPPPPNEPVKGTVVRPPDAGTAFTGSDLGIWLVAIAALVVIGAVLLLVGRRRAASAA